MNKPNINLTKLFEDAIDSGDIAIIPKGFSSKNPIRLRLYKNSKIGNVVVKEADDDAQPNDTQPEKAEIKVDNKRTSSSDIMNNIQRKIDLINKDVVVCGAQLDDNTIIQFYVKPKDAEQLELELEQLIAKSVSFDTLLEELDRLFISYRIYRAVDNDKIDGDTNIKPRDFGADSENLGKANKTVYDKEYGNQFGTPTTVMPQDTRNNY